MARQEKDRIREREREKRRRGNRKYGQAKLKHAKRGIFSCGFAVASGLLLIVLLGIAYISDGMGASYVGGLGLIAFILSCVGTFFGIKGLKERNKNYITCKIGIGCNLFFVAGFIGIFCRGLF